MFSKVHTLINEAEIAVENPTEEQIKAWVAELPPPGAPVPTPADWRESSRSPQASSSAAAPSLD
jgi:hypothetical protein